jgi:hypothetical protein
MRSVSRSSAASDGQEIVIDFLEKMIGKVAPSHVWRIDPMNVMLSRLRVMVELIWFGHFAG